MWEIATFVAKNHMKKKEFMCMCADSGMETRYNLEDVVVAHHEVRGKLLTTDNLKFCVDYCTPILFPISCLTKEIQIANYNDGKPFIPYKKLGWTIGYDGKIGDMIDFGDSHKGVIEPIQYISDIQQLVSWHINLMDESEDFIPVTEGFNPYK